MCPPIIHIKKVFSLIEKWTAPLRLPTGRKARTVYVYVPDEINNHPEARFPVLYMFDGHNVFFDEEATYGKSWGLKEYLDETQSPVIVVAVDCNHNPNNGRLSEYSPFTFDDEHLGHIVGRGKRYMEWLVNELKPLIDAQYPTLPEREATWIAGSSMGGLMSLYAISAYHEVFSKAAALSPSVWVAPKKLNKLIRQTAFDPDTVVYMDYGSREFESHDRMRKLFIDTADVLLQQGVMLNCRIVPGGEHCEACWEEQNPFWMNTLLYERQ